MIDLKNVSKEYPRRGHALRDVSLHVAKSEFVFLTGHSGSGKSTTMRLIHMADRPTAGEVRVAAYSSERISDRDVWKVRRRVGFVFQDFRLLPGRTATENVAFALEVTGTKRSEILPRSQKLLGQVGLSAKSGALVHELSGGEQQRVAIARAFASDPAVLFADEPTGNLDNRTGQSVSDLLMDLNREQGTTLVMVTHDERLAARCGRQLHIEAGVLTEPETAREMAD